MRNRICPAPFHPLLLALSCLAAMPALAQDPQAEDPAATGPPVEAGRTAETGVGEVGQRQTREAGAPGVEPMRRIDNRLRNRIENRIRNRIDRHYDPRANTTSPFEVAREEAERAGRRARPQ